MKKNYILILIFVAAIFQFGCNENPSNPVVNKSMYEINNSSYWIYQNYSLDSNNKVDKYFGNDSVIVSAPASWQGKSGYEIIHFTYNAIKGNFEKLSEYKYASTSSQVFISTDYFTAFAGGFFKLFASTMNLAGLNNQWIKIADANVESFQLFDKPIEMKNVKLPGLEGEDMPIDPSKISIDITYNATVTKKEKGTFTDMNSNKNVNTQKYELLHKIKIDISVELPFIGKTPIPMDNPYISLVQYMTYAEGISLVASVTPSQRVKLAAKIPGSTTETSIFDEMFEGGGKKLIKYKN